MSYVRSAKTFPSSIRCVCDAAVPGIVRRERTIRGDSVTIEYTCGRCQPHMAWRRRGALRGIAARRKRSDGRLNVYGLLRSRSPRPICDRFDWTYLLTNIGTLAFPIHKTEVRHPADN